MKLDQFAEEAARDAQQAGRTMPIIPIEKLRRRRLYLMVPMVTTGIAASVLAVVFLLPPTTPQQPVGEPTETTIDTATTTTTPMPTTTTPQIIAPPDTPWVRGTVEQIVDAEGSVLFEFPPTILYGRNTAWDGGDGFVALTDEGLIWMRPDQRQTIDAPFGAILDMAITETGTHVVGIEDAEDRSIRWFALESGDEVEAPSSARTTDGNTYTFGERTVTIVDPDWSDNEKDETGMPLRPFDLPELVVTDGGTEVLRITVGSEDRPFVEIHDFDGRRLIIGALPVEPAVPPSTVWIIDLECGDCTQRFDTDSLEYFDLIGVLPTEGEVAEPELS
jgi:hypothetical protein